MFACRLDQTTRLNARQDRATPLLDAARGGLPLGLGVNGCLREQLRETLYRSLFWGQ